MGNCFGDKSIATGARTTPAIEISQGPRDDNKNKIALSGVGHWGQRRKLPKLGKKKAYTALLQCRTFPLPKKWGPQRKDFGGGYGFLVLIGILYPPLTWKVCLWGQKSSQMIFFRWWSCTLLSSHAKRCFRGKRHDNTNFECSRVWGSHLLACTLSTPLMKEKTVLP